jgi:hypothetical protein
VGEEDHAKEVENEVHAAPPSRGTISPLPWTMTKPDNAPFQIMRPRTTTSETIAEVYSGEEDAAFIVRACNSHEALVSALNATFTYIALTKYEPDIGEKPILKDASFDKVMASARAALALARSEAP